MRGHGFADHPDEAIHPAILVLVGATGRAVSQGVMPVVFMTLALGVLEEVDVGSQVASTGCYIVYIEVLAGQCGLEAPIELFAAIFGHHRQQVRVRAQVDSLVGGGNERVDRGAEGLDTGEAHTSPIR